MTKFESWMTKHYKSRTYIRVLKSYLGSNFTKYANSSQNIELANEIRLELVNIDDTNDKHGDLYRSLRTLCQYLTVGQDFSRKEKLKKQKINMSKYLFSLLEQYEKHNKIKKKSLVLRILYLKRKGYSDATSKEYAHNSYKTGFDRNGHKHRARQKFIDYDEDTFVNEYCLHGVSEILTYINTM
jgi:hypothetical protein